MINYFQWQNQLSTQFDANGLIISFIKYSPLQWHSPLPPSPSFPLSPSLPLTPSLHLFIHYQSSVLTQLLFPLLIITLLFIPLHSLFLSFIHTPKLSLVLRHCPLLFCYFSHVITLSLLHIFAHFPLFGFRNIQLCWGISAEEWIQSRSSSAALGAFWIQNIDGDIFLTCLQLPEITSARSKYSVIVVIASMLKTQLLSAVHLATRV